MCTLVNQSLRHYLEDTPQKLVKTALIIYHVTKTDWQNM